MKVIKWIGIGLVSTLILLFVGFQVLMYTTKKASPEKTAEYSYQENKLSVWYCSPSKKGREIFGGLEPFEEVWRTGANEPTSFTTSTNILFGDVEVAPGTYTLWTIPGPADWTIILNSKMYDWGVDWNEQASREAEFDVALVNAIAEDLPHVVENLYIGFEHDVNLIIKWDKTKVTVPITLNP